MEGGNGYHLGEDGPMVEYTVDIFWSVEQCDMYDKLEKRDHLLKFGIPALSTTHWPSMDE